MKKNYDITKSILAQHSKRKVPLDPCLVMVATKLWLRSPTLEAIEANHELTPSTDRRIQVRLYGMESGTVTGMVAATLEGNLPVLWRMYVAFVKIKIV